jgi:hypothetical protein
MEEASPRRRYPRVQLDGRVEGRATISADFRVVALSEDGATLEMGLPVLVGVAIDISLNLSHASVDVRGRVVQVERLEGEHISYAIGVEFENLGDFDRALLRSFLQRQGRLAV